MLEQELEKDLEENLGSSLRWIHRRSVRKEAKEAKDSKEADWAAVP